MSLLAIAAASDSVLQDRMAENVNRVEVSARSANSALGWAEDWLLGLDGSSRPQPCTADCGPLDIIRGINSYPVSPEYADTAWWSAHGRADGHDPSTGQVLADRWGNSGAPGLWIAEEVWFEDTAQDGSGRPATSYYRIIARGDDSAGYAAVTESVIARPWGLTEWTDAFPADLEDQPFCRSHEISGPCGRLAWRQRR